MRYLVAFASVLAGIGVAVLEFILAAPNEMAKDSPEESVFVFGLCVTFYGVVYLTGRGIYRLFGRPDQSREVRQTSGAHMLVLHSFALVLAVLPFFFEETRRGASTILMLVAFALVIVSIVDYRKSRDRLETNTISDE